MGLSQSDYGRQLLTTLPPGRAFSREPGSRLAGLFEGLGGELARADQRIEDLAREAHPGKAVELLPEWEALLGLPDPCAPAPTTTAGRQAAALAKIGALGDPRPAGLEALALALGVPVTVVEFRGTDCTQGDCESPVLGPDWAHAFAVLLALGTVTVADCASPCNSPLQAWANEALECAFAIAKPAHSAALYFYS